MSTLLEKLSEKQSMKPESQQNMGTSCLHCPHANIHSGMGVWSWLQKKFSKMKAEKEPEEFEFGCEDLTKDWFDEISDMEEQEEKIKCDENDFFDNEQDSVEPDSEPDKARTGGIWDWDSEDYWAYGESELLFDTLGVRNYPITKKSDKLKWKNLKTDLEEARRRRAIDVLNVIYESKLIPVPPKVEVNLKFYKDKTEIQYGSNTSLKEFLELEYSQFLSAINFLYPDSDFSTEHGVKGEEYDNVIFVISKGWNQYQFEKYIPMITGDERIPIGKDVAFERNRNLFYVCCSRPKKRLLFFVTVPMEQYLYSFFEKYIGKNNIFTYKEYLDNY